MPETTQQAAREFADALKVFGRTCGKTALSIEWLRWFVKRPFRAGDPLLGTGETRTKNIDILLKRHRDREPNKGEPPNE